MQIVAQLSLVLSPAVVHFVDVPATIEWVSPLKLMLESSSTDGFPIGIAIFAVAMGAMLVWRTRISWDRKVSLN